VPPPHPASSIDATSATARSVAEVLLTCLADFIATDFIVVNFTALQLPWSPAWREANAGMTTSGDPSDDPLREGPPQRDPHRQYAGRRNLRSHCPQARVTCLDQRAIRVVAEGYLKAVTGLPELPSEGPLIPAPLTDTPTSGTTDTPTLRRTPTSPCVCGRIDVRSLYIVVTRM
jgi:hypothetical protein